MYHSRPDQTRQEQTRTQPKQAIQYDAIIAPGKNVENIK